MTTIKHDLVELPEKDTFPFKFSHYYPLIEYNSVYIQELLDKEPFNFLPRTIYYFFIIPQKCCSINIFYRCLHF
jgi:hypothetical protein